MKITSDISLRDRLLQIWLLEVKAFRPAIHASASVLSLQICEVSKDQFNIIVEENITKINREKCMHSHFSPDLVTFHRCYI